MTAGVSQAVRWLSGCFAVKQTAFLNHGVEAMLLSRLLGLIPAMPNK